MALESSLRQYRNGTALCDFVIVAVAYALAVVGVHLLRYDLGEGIPVGYVHAFPYAVLIQVLMLRAAARTFDRELVAVAAGATLGLATLLSIGFFYRDFSYSRIAAVGFGGLTFAMVPVARALYRRTLRGLFRGSRWDKRVVILGDGAESERLGEQLAAAAINYSPIARLPLPRIEGEAASADLRDAMWKLLDEHGPDLVVLADRGLPPTHERTLVDCCVEADVHWMTLPRTPEGIDQPLEFTQVGPLTLVGSRGNNITGFHYYLKRWLDLTLALGLLALTAPLMALIAAAVKLASPDGPVLFRQERLGYRKRPFTLYKFRSMHPGSAEDTHRDYAARWISGEHGDVGEGPTGVHKLTRDPRVIPVIGSLIRKLSLDELPQLWNVVRGDMSLVGPRPCIPYELDHYRRWHWRRFDALPGITGLWQVSGRNQLDFDQMVQLDIRYLQNWSVLLDLSIIVRTPWVMVSGKAY